VPGGFVQWMTAPTHEESYAYSLAEPGHWDLRDIVAVVSREHKAVGSGGGHDAVATSAYFGARLDELTSRFPDVRKALLERDFATFGPAVEAEALSLHAVAMTSRPPILYWEPGTVALMLQAARWRQEGLPVYYTLDAGPNVHLIVEGAHADALEGELRDLDYVESWLHNRPGGPAQIVPDEGE
jgi:diphosphomevalonate decarboxylase